MPVSKAKHGGAPARLSLRALAKKLKVSHPAVIKGVRSGRLSGSIARDARGPHVTDLALARREWAAGAGQPANDGRRGGRQARAVVTPRREATQPGGTLVQAQYRVAVARAVALELANRQRSGELLDRETVKRHYFEAARIIRERILNVPDRLAELDPALRNRIRAELRQALGEIADELEHE